MIRTALEFIRNELDAYIVERENDPPNYTLNNVVELKPIMTLNGTVNISDSAHVALMLIGVDEERREGVRPFYVPADDQQFMRLNAPVEINLFLLFAAQNSDYPTALRDVSDVIAFFQANPVFTEQKFPQLNATVDDPVNKPWRLIQRLSFSMHHLSFEQQNNLWAMLGSKYLPSVVYKAKILTVFETKSKQKEPAVSELNFNDNAVS
jgi:hypothetical protein